MNLSRYCRGSVDGKNTSMDREAVKNLLARQNVSRLIEKLSRNYRDEIHKDRWIKNAIKSIKKRRKKGLIDANLSRNY